MAISVLINKKRYYVTFVVIQSFIENRLSNECASMNLAKVPEFQSHVVLMLCGKTYILNKNNKNVNVLSCMKYFMVWRNLCV